jgi:hypothetical protein
MGGVHGRAFGRGGFRVRDVDLFLFVTGSLFARLDAADNAERSREGDDLAVQEVVFAEVKGWFVLWSRRLVTEARMEDCVKTGKA